MSESEHRDPPPSTCACADPPAPIETPSLTPSPALAVTNAARRVVSRRSFAASLGMALVAAPFLGLLGGRGARAAGGRSIAAGTRARRLVVVFTPNGTIPRLWRPTGTETSFSFPAGSLLEPLAAWKERMIILDGLDFAGANNHEGGMANMLTGGGGGESGGMSIDQFVAGRIGGATRLRSLELGVATSAWGGGAQTRMSYGGPGQYVPPDDSPANVFGRVYGDAPAGGADASARRRQSVLDAIKGDLSALQTRLGTEERRKLDAHVSALRELERGLSGGTCNGGVPVAELNPYDNASFPVIGQTQMDLLVASLACGATSVASLQWAHTVAPTVFSWLGLSDGHHSLSHMADDNAAGVAQFVKAERWFAEQFAYLLGKLEATPDPEGGTLLDSTLVLWTKEMGDSRAHVCESVPMVIAGAGFTTGRYLKSPARTPHARALLSICHAMGLDNQSFGDPTHGGTPLAGL